ncbi:MAG TPA: hypothetical protein VFG79_11365, partial [Solirubrobacter sp.]|nr:hypothetical protein [Solirubrobacter sp.]
EEFADNLAYEKLARALRWLDDDGEEARRRFAEAAADLKAAAIDTGRGEQATTWAQYGHLLRNAGDQDGARTAYEHALALADERLDGYVVMELRYLLGRDPGRGPEGVIRQTLHALSARDLDAIRAARAALVTGIRGERADSPAETGPGLTLFDLLELTFVVEAELAGAPPPDHRAMLERAGLLDRGAPAPAVDPPPVGCWTAGGATLKSGQEGPITVTFADDWWLEIVDLRRGYEVRQRRRESELFSTGPHATFGETIEAAADALAADAPEHVPALREVVATLPRSPRTPPGPGSPT